MIKESIQQEQVKLISDPYEFLKVFSQNDLVKIVEFNKSIFPDVILYDISLTTSGPQEDETFALNENIRENIRRGNTIIQLLDSEGKVTSTQWARRGTHKFYDLYREYIEYNLQQRSQLKDFGIQSNEVLQNLHGLQFDAVRKALRAGDKVKVYSTEKLNGENVQVTWQASTQSWLVASKNVSLLARQRSDLSIYTQDRFKYASIMAQTWFDIVDDIEKKLGAHKVELLKEDLKNRTIIGEYIGNPKCQHVIRYDYETIRWFGIQEFQSDSLCFPLIQALEFFNHYNLEVVECLYLDTFTDFIQFNKLLLHRYDFVSQSNIDIEREEKPNHQEKVLSVCKLKSLEYRIFRKLREKIRTFLDDKSLLKRDVISKFKKEVSQQLCVVNKPARKLQFYYDLADIVFDFADQYPGKSYLIHERYVDFLSVALDCLQMNKDIHPQMFNEQNINKLKKIKWSSYFVETFIPLMKPMPTEESNKPQIEPQQPLQQTQAKEQVQIKLEKKTIFAFIPIGIPGMGKSVFSEHLQTFVQEKYQLTQVQVVSNDKFRQAVIIKEREKNQTLSEDQLYELSSKKSNYNYEDAIKKIVKSFVYSSDIVLFLVMDKNHPPNGIEKAVSMIKGCTPSTVDLVTVGLVPLCMNLFDRQEKQLPFSFHFLLQCIERVQTRENHETLNGRGVESLQTMFLFISMFSKFTISQGTLPSINYLMKFPFVVETIDSDNQYDQNIEDDFVDILDATEPNKKCTNKNLLLSFLDSMRDNDVEAEQFNQEDFDHNVQIHVEQLLKKYNMEGALQKQHTAPQQTVLVQQKQPVQKSVEPVPTPQLPESDDNSDVRVNQQQPQQEQNQDNDDQLSNNQEVKKRRRHRGKATQEKSNKLVSYNPTYLPLYLGIFVTTNRNQTDRLLSKWIKECFDYGDYKFKEDPDLVRMKAQWQNSVYSTGTFYELSKPLHITTLHIGAQGDEMVRSLPYFKEFRPESEHSITLTALIASPDNILTALVMPPSIPIQNTYPHMTLFTAKLKAKDSNEVISSVLSQDPNARNMYKSGQLTSPSNEELAFKIKWNFKGKPAVAYLLKPENSITFEGVARAYDR